MATSPRKLADVLAQADAGERLPTVDTAALASCVRRVAQRRSRVRQITAGAATALTLLVLSVVAWRTPWSPHPPLARNSGPPPLTPAQIETARSELLTMQKETQRREALVERLLANERRRLAASGLRQASAAPDALQRLRYEQDRAALVLIHQADALSRTARHKESAANSYRRVVELFPQSQWAAVARQRLHQFPG